MKKRSVNLLGYFILLVVVSESSVIKPRSLPSDDPPRIVRPKDEELPQKFPDVSEIDKNLRRRPPFGDPKLAADDDDLGIFDSGIPINPSEYDYKNTVNRDNNGRDFSKPGRKPETRPDVNKGGYPVEERGDEDTDVHEESNKDRGIHKPLDHGSGESFDAEEIDVEKPFDHGPFEPSDADDIDNDIHKTNDHGSGDAEKYTEKPDEDEGELDDEHIDEDVHKDIDEPENDSEDDEDFHKDIDNSFDGAEGDEDVETVDESDAEPSYGGFVFETPFFNVRQVTKYFEQLEKALEQVFKQTLDEAALLNGTYANTTEDEIEIGGKKYIVHKSIITGKDNDSAIYVEALSRTPKTNETKEEKEDSGI